jgi:hypothetical protein
MPKFFTIERPKLPWGDYGSILVNRGSATHFYAVSCGDCEVLFPPVCGKNGWHFLAKSSRLIGIQPVMDAGELVSTFDNGEGHRMGLDAVVYCDCFETGRLREPAPPGCELAVAPDGSLFCGNDDLNVQLAFDQWLHSRACEHEDGVLLHHYLGNTATVAALRTELQRLSAQFAIILTKVIYNGVHAGDHLGTPEIAGLVSEIAVLSDLRGSTPDRDQLVRHFESQIAALVQCAQRVSKPISF